MITPGPAAAGMRENSDIRFNALKHHLGFLRKEIYRWKALEWPRVAEELLKLGNNQFDLYAGLLPVAAILGGTSQILITNGAAEREQLRTWLGKKGYRSFVLSDGSRWVVRESGHDGLAHIHPARHQPLVQRVKASHLKTIVALLWSLTDPLSLTDANQPLEWSTPFINQIRRERLGLSPVRSLEESRRIAQTFRLILGPDQMP